MGILDQIANPQMLNIKQTLDIRQKRIEADEAKRKKLRMGQLISEAVPNLKAGSSLHKMALEDPDQFALVSKAMGVPLNAGDQMQELMNDTSELYMRAQADPDDAYNRALEIKAERNKAGRETPQMDRWIDLMEKDPQTGLTSLFVFHRSMNPEGEGEQFTLGDTRYDAKGNVIASNPRGAGGEDRTANAKDLETYKRLVAEGDPSAESFGRMIGMSSQEGEKLSAFAEKQVSTSSDEANSARASSSRYQSLAERLKKSSANGGLRSTWTEYLKEQTGNQDEITELKKQALEISNSEAIKNLPPGPATDRDIEIAKAPFPTEKSSPEYVANWLETMSRLNQKRADYAEFKADFIAKNGTVRTKDGVSINQAWKKTQEGGSGNGAMTTGITGSTDKKETAAERLARLRQGGN